MFELALKMVNFSSLPNVNFGRGGDENRLGAKKISRPF